MRRILAAEEGDPSHFDVLDAARGFRDWQAIFGHAFQVKFNSRANHPFDFPGGTASRNASWQIRHISGQIGTGIFDYDGIAFHFSSIILPTPPA
jgi:hypothetical protein